MSAGGGFAAGIIESSAGGLAGLAAGLLYERDERFAARYGDDGFARWKEQLESWLGQLAAALDADEPSLFESRARWTRDAFASREIDLADLRGALEALRDTLGERLPDAVARTAVPVVERALAAVARTPVAGDDGLRDERVDDRRALDYLRTILEGRPREAVDRVLAEVDDGSAVRDAYLRWLLPAQREAGRLWHVGELTIAEERLVTSTTQRLMALLCERERPDRPLGRTVVLACVRRNVHDLGLRAIADLHEMAGWDVINLGADVPPEEIANAVRFFEPQLVVLAATLETHIRAATESIAAVRSVGASRPKLVVGGQVFDEAPELWRRLGADGHARSIEEAEPLGRRLTDPSR